jgi:sialic acid synthase SpsE
MSYLGEVEAAVRTIVEAGNRSLVLLQCTSSYPAAPKDVNLRAMDTLARAFGFPVGYSDHTEGIEIAIAAAALGAHVLEKHFTLDKALPGPDHRASITPDELTRLVAAIRKVEAALGTGLKIPAASERDTASVARKSLVAARYIPADTILTEDLIEVKRPGTGLPPAAKASILGRRTRRELQAGDLIRPESLQ